MREKYCRFFDVIRIVDFKVEMGKKSANEIKYNVPL